MDKIMKRSSIAFFVALTLSNTAFAAGAPTLPTNGNVVVGNGAISQTGNVMTINQNTDLLAINWNTFNVGPNSTVNFVQPSAHSVALNRVLGSDVSVIQGKINANGYVALINPNGILFTSTAQVNVGGLVASTLNISNKNFKAGNFTLSGFSSNAVINQGNISVLDGGTVAFVAAKISNQGTIVANKGNVLFGAGSKVKLDFGGPVSIEVKRSAVDALIENGGAIRANGGVVYFTVSAANKLATTVINNTGIIEAQTLATGEKGEIHLLGDQDNDHIRVDGTLDVGAPEGGEEGTVYIDAASVEYADSAVLSLEAITKVAKAADEAVVKAEAKLAKAEKTVANAQKPVEKAKARAKAQIAKAEKAAAKAKANAVKVEVKAKARIASAQKALDKANAAAKKASDNAAAKLAIAKKTGTKKAWNQAKKAQVNANKKATIAKKKAVSLAKTTQSAKKSIAIAQKKAAAKSANVKRVTSSANKAVAVAEKKAAPRIAKATAKKVNAEKIVTAANNKAEAADAKAKALAKAEAPVEPPKAPVEPPKAPVESPKAPVESKNPDTSNAQADAQKSNTPLLTASNSRTSIKIQSIEDAPTAAGGDEEEAEGQSNNELVITYIGDGINLPE
jgi:filamentous hemagglutinin family protein